MKEFKKSVLLVILWQIIGWVIFAFCDEAIQILYNDLQKYLLSIIFLIVTPIIYLIYSKKIITKNNYSSKKFNAFFLILWNIQTGKTRKKILRIIIQIYLNSNVQGLLFPIPLWYYGERMKAAC